MQYVKVLFQLKIIIHFQVSVTEILRKSVNFLLGGLYIYRFSSMSNCVGCRLHSSHCVEQTVEQQVKKGVQTDKKSLVRLRAAWSAGNYEISQWEVTRIFISQRSWSCHGAHTLTN